MPEAASISSVPRIPAPMKPNRTGLMERPAALFTWASARAAVPTAVAAAARSVDFSRNCLRFIERSAVMCCLQRTGFRLGACYAPRETGVNARAGRGYLRPETQGS